MKNSQPKEELLRVENLSVLVNKKFLVQDVSLSLNKGEILGIVGKNSSGKTSLIKAIVRALPISEGEVYFDGKVVYKDKQEIDSSYVADINTALDPPMFYKWQTVLENIKFIANFKTNYSQKEVYELLKEFDLFKKRHTRVMKLTYFEKKKMSLLLCLISSPKLIILDEPFRGLEDDTITKFKHKLQALVAHGTGVLIVSNDFKNMKAMCSNVLFMENRQIKTSLDAKEISKFKRLDNYTYIRTKYPHYAAQLIKNCYRIGVKIMGNRVLLMNATEEQVSSIIRFLTDKKFIIYDIGQLTNEAEEIFASLTPNFREEEK